MGKAGRSGGPYLTFLPDAFWSSDWDEKARAENRRAVIRRLKANDIDLVIAMGTWAGRDLATDEHNVATMVTSTSDPVSAGIVKIASDSGRDHVWARTNPDRYKQRVRMFHRIFGFHEDGDRL